MLGPCHEHRPVGLRKGVRGEAIGARAVVQQESGRNEAKWAATRRIRSAARPAKSANQVRAAVRARLAGRVGVDHNRA
jgi:predicted deacetylase